MNITTKERLIIALYLFGCFLLVACHEAKAHHEHCVVSCEKTIVAVVETDKESSNTESKESSE